MELKRGTRGREQARPLPCQEEQTRETCSWAPSLLGRLARPREVVYDLGMFNTRQNRQSPVRQASGHACVDDLN